jgi:hypothetical protein
MGLKVRKFPEIQLSFMHATISKRGRLMILLATAFCLTELPTTNAMKLRQSSEIDATELPRLFRPSMLVEQSVQVPAAELNEFIADTNAGVPFTSEEAAEAVVTPEEVPPSEHKRARNSITLNPKALVVGSYLDPTSDVPIPS